LFCDCKTPILFYGSGIRRVIDDAVKKPSPSRESGVEALLFNIMKGYTSRFHSKAGRVLQLLTSEAIYPIGDKANQGKLVLSDTLAFFFFLLYIPCPHLVGWIISLLLSYHIS